MSVGSIHGVLVEPQKPCVRVRYGLLFTFHGARRKPYGDVTGAERLSVTVVYANRPSSTVCHGPLDVPNQSACHTSSAKSASNGASLRFASDQSSVKSQYGAARCGAIACTLASNSAVSAMCCVRKPSPSCSRSTLRRAPWSRWSATKWSIDRYFAPYAASPSSEPTSIIVLIASKKPPRSAALISRSDRRTYRHTSDATARSPTRSPAPSPRP